MAKRKLLDLVTLFGRGILDDLSGPAKNKVISEIDRSISPADKLPKSFSNMSLTGLRPSQQPVKEMLDPLEYSKTKLTRPIEAYEGTITPTNKPLLPKKTITLEDLEGGYLLPLYGDRSSGAGLLTQVGNIPLQRSYNLDGGIDFMRGPANQADDVIWASGAGVMKPLASKAKEILEKTGKPVYGTTISMLPNALDFAKFTPRVAADLMQQFMTKKSAKVFDAELRTRKGMSDWVGIHSDKLDDWLKNATPDQNKTFLRFADSDEARKNYEAVPDAVGAARYAVTDPSQYSLPSGYAGASVGRFTKGILDNPTVPHSSYSTQAKGVYEGGLEVPIKHDELFRDAFNKYYSPNYVNLAGQKGGLSGANATYAHKTQNTPQLVDAELVDNYMKRLEQVKSLGLLD